MNTNDLNWLAGILEADGTFSCRTSRGSTRWTVQVGMIDEDVIRRCRDVSGMGLVRGPYQSPAVNRRPMWFWSVGTRSEARALMELVRPLMGDRRRRKIDACLAGVTNAEYVDVDA